MNTLNLRTKAIAIASLIGILLVGAVIYIALKLESSADEIVESSKLVTESAAHRLTTAGFHTIDSLYRISFFELTSPSRNDLRHADSLLSFIAGTELFSFHGMEGGFYFPKLDEFLGYSFPTSPSPKPAYGPPPRSHAIIKEQCLLTIEQQRKITDVHQFDPAKFPLVTEPIVVQGKVIGCVWARVHIERLIPTFSLIDVLIAAATLFLIGFAIVLIFTWNMRKHVEEIRLGLRTLHTDSAFRFKGKRGVFGEITNSINEMNDARAQEQLRRKKLENDLHQQDKMVTLGTLIAGVAHEVKTPLAVIKTRIQMWERKLRQQRNENEPDGVVTPDSMDLVIHEIDRVSDLVKRLLIFSKPVTNKLRATDINQLISHTLLLTQPAVEEKAIAVHTVLAAGLSPVHVDPSAIEQVFLNVLNNSIEAMQQEGALTLRTFLAEHSMLAIEIEDNGSGISEETMNKIFNPFFTTKESGVGLGLSISYEIIRAHNGKIEFPRSNPHGTLCRILLPIQ